MKSIVAVLLLAVSVPSFSQSFLQTDDGKIYTSDEKGLFYDLGNNIPPQRLISKGKNWMIDDDGSVHTVSSEGFFYRDMATTYAELPKVKGHSWFVTGDNQIFIINRAGLVFTYPLTMGGSIAIKGGNWFVVENNNFYFLYTVDTQQGTYAPVDMRSMSFNPRNITVSGGNWFMNNENILFSVDLAGGLHRYYGSIPTPRLKGANYFVDRENVLKIVLTNGQVVSTHTPERFGFFRQAGMTTAWNENMFYSFAETANISRWLEIGPELDQALQQIVVIPFIQIDARRAITVF